MDGRERTQRLRTALILLGLFVAAWLPRVVALDAFVTIDERKWLTRSANFYEAVSHGDLANTFQREHPGVTVMWAGTLGFLQKFPDYPQAETGQFAWDREHFEAWLTENTELSPLEMLAAGRWWVVLGVALAITAGFFPLRRLFGETIALICTLYLAWSPFYIALSRQLHPDGLVASLTLLALLLFLAWLYGNRQWRYLITSGVVMGLAWLTKTPAIFLVPTGLVLIALEWWSGRRGPAGVSASRLFAGYVVWGLIATAFFVLFWPAMWLDPLGTLTRMVAEMSDYVERHTNINYFWGRPTDDPGIFFYPVAWLWRITPLTLSGLISAAVLGRKRVDPLVSIRGRRAALALVIYTLIFTGFMTIGAKKFDRYMLPVFLALELVAALGLAGVAGWLAEIRWSPRAANLLLGGAIFLHGLLGFIHYPYYLTYYNPVVGGQWTAPFALFAGWGEGLDDAATWLNAQPDIDDQRTVAWYHDGPFSYFYNGQTDAISSTSPMLWLDADYAVVYINQVQRQIPSPAGIDFFAQQTPIHTVNFRGLELANVYDMREIALPDFIEIGKEATADFGGRIRLLAYEFSDEIVAPGDEVQATFYLQARASMETNYNVLVRLLAPDGSEVWREDGWPWGAPTVEWPVREIRPDGHPIVLPEDLAPGVYKVEFSVFDPADYAPLPVTEMDSTTLLSDTSRDIALLQVGMPGALPALTDGSADFGGITSLVGSDVPAQAAPGDLLPVTLQWESLAPTAVDYTTFVHIVDGEGNQVAGRDQPPLAGFAPTHTWRPGQRLNDVYEVQLPAELPSGDYTVRVGLYTLDGGRLPVSVEGNPAGDFVAVAKVRVD